MSRAMTLGVSPLRAPVTRSFRAFNLLPDRNIFISCCYVTTSAPCFTARPAQQHFLSTNSICAKTCSVIKFHDDAHSLWHSCIIATSDRFVASTQSPHITCDPAHVGRGTGGQHEAQVRIAWCTESADRHASAAAFNKHLETETRSDIKVTCWSAYPTRLPVRRRKDARRDTCTPLYLPRGHCGSGAQLPRDAGRSRATYAGTATCTDLSFAVWRQP